MKRERNASIKFPVEGVDYKSRLQKRIRIVMLHGCDEGTLIFQVVNLNQIELTEYKRIVARKCIKFREQKV